MRGIFEIIAKNEVGCFVAEFVIQFIQLGKTRQKWSTSMRIGSLELTGVTALAPMAGVTDWAYRTVCGELGAALTVTEMVSSRALVYQDKKSLGLLKKTPKGICGAQIFGNDPEVMAQGAKLALEHSGCDFIDINMGCPMPKIVNNGDGSALMKNPELAGKIVRAVVDAVDVPVTVKMRIGWDRGSINAVEMGKILQDNGASALAIHGRTKSMLYSGQADWDTIRKVKQTLSVPILANGDIFGPQEAQQCIKRTGADMVMIGRGAFGNPWIFGQVNAALTGGQIPELPPLAQRMDVALHQFELAMEYKGEHIACLEARKHFAWYLHGVAYSNFYKEQISSVCTAEDVYKITAGIKRDLR